MLAVSVKTDSAMFASLPQVRLWHDLRDHLQALPGVEVTGFLTDGVIGSWLDFYFRGHRFTVSEREGSYHAVSFRNGG